MAGSNIPGLPLYQKKVCTSIYNKYCITTLTTSSPSNKRSYLHFRFSSVCAVPVPDSVENVLKLERPRTIKTHLSYDMLPKQISQKGAKVHNIHYIMFKVMITLNKFTFF